MTFSSAFSSSFLSPFGDSAAFDSDLFLDFEKGQYGDAGKSASFSDLVTFTRSTTATFVDVDGNIASAAIDSPRFDYSTGRRGLLKEESATNICDYSSEADNAGWLKQSLGSGTVPVVTANQATSPDGTTTADLVTFDVSAGTGSGDRSLLVPSKIGSITDSVTRTFSIYIKSSSATSYNMRLRINGGIEDITVTSEWQRFDVQGSSGSDGTIHLGLYNSINSDTASVYIWGCQIETGNYPSSYIPTSGSSVTRAEDVITLEYENLVGNILNSNGSMPDAFSIAYKGCVSFTDNNSSQEVSFFNWQADGSNFTRSLLRTNTGDGEFWIRQRALGVEDSVAGGSPTAGQNVQFSVASRHGATFVNGASNGTAFTEDTTPTSLPDLSTSDMMAFDIFNGVIYILKAWNSDIGNSGLEEQTA